MKEPATQPSHPAERVRVPVLVVGAGPAGLAVSRELARRRIEHLVLEADSIGSSWARYYRSLVLHTGKHLSHLPGKPHSRGMPLFPPRERFLEYLREYAAQFSLPIRERTRVVSARRTAEGWVLETSAGSFAAQALIVATGVAANPHRPYLVGEDDFRGEVLHSAEYSDPGPFRGRRVLVVGVGNSGGEIAGELSLAGVETVVSVRSGAHLMPLRILGVPSQYWGAVFGILPEPIPERVARGIAGLRRALAGPPPLPAPDRPILGRAPLLGDSLPSALRSGRVGLRGRVERLVPGGARYHDGSEEPFDAVILATGYRPALDFLGALVRLDDAGFPLRRGVLSRDHPDLFFVGHEYGPAGALSAIRRDARRAARDVSELLSRIFGSPGAAAGVAAGTDQPGSRARATPARP